MKIDTNILLNFYRKFFSKELGFDFLHDLDNAPFEYKIECLVSTGYAFCHKRNDEIHGMNSKARALNLYMFPDMLKEVIQKNGY